MYPPKIVAGKNKKGRYNHRLKKNYKTRRTIFQPKNFIQMLKNRINIDPQFYIPFRNLIPSKRYKIF